MENDSVDKLIKNAAEYIQKSKLAEDDPESLSKMINRLARLNFFLGVFQSQYDKDSSEMKLKIDLEEAQLIMDSTEAVEKAKARAKVALGNKRREYNKLMGELNKVKIIVNRIRDVNEVGRSRLSLIKQDIKADL